MPEGAGTPEDRTATERSNRMYANKKTRRRIAALTKAGVEIILIFLAFRIGGPEAGLLAIAAAGVASIRTDIIQRTELVTRDRRQGE